MPSISCIRRLISIHALREEGDPLALVQAATVVHISIHSLREEADTETTDTNHADNIFLSTPSARRATKKMLRRMMSRVISIHALREEGDLSSWFSPPLVQ